MPSAIDTRFREWIHGLDPRGARISIFQHIRDIPYSLHPPMTDPKTAPYQILESGRGSCGPKHYLMAEMYRRLGLEVAFATIPFVWNDPDIRYPPKLRELASGLPVSYHLACRVRIDSRWVLVDATWDRPLKRAGFPVNEFWDGRSDTLCAVKPLKSAVRTAFCHTVTNEPCRQGGGGGLNPLDGELDHMDREDRARYYREKTGLRTPEEIHRIREFFEKFDRWLETLRQGA